MMRDHYRSIAPLGQSQRRKSPDMDLSAVSVARRNQVGLSTLDFWRRKYASPRMVEVRLESKQPATSLSIVLDNGRRIESSGNFSARLIRIAESA